ncbi:MAG: hypothetical protein H7Y00_12800 [Fimbriimonadaceae bacterium]|nr:hypothetical protein [Chitinophagales bacterium]
MHNKFGATHFINAWKYFFLFMGFSTGIGVFVHGFKIYFYETAYHYTWMAMNIAAALASYFTIKATVKFLSRNVKERKKLNLINLFSLLTFISITFIQNNFETVKIYIGTAVAITFISHLIGHMKEDLVSKYIMLGMGISFLTLFIHSTQFSFSVWFDYKAISHVIMMVSLILVYRGVFIANRRLAFTAVQ